MGGTGSKSPSEHSIVVNNNIVVAPNNVNKLESNFNISDILLVFILILAFVISLKFIYYFFMKSKCLRKESSSQVV